MSFHPLTRHGVLLLLALAACTTTASSPPPEPGEPFAVISNRVQGFTDASFLTAFTDRNGGTWLAGNVAIALYRPPGGGWSHEPVPIEGTVTGLWQDGDGHMLAAAGSQLLRRNATGTTWEPVPIPSVQQLLDIWGLDSERLFLAGTDGAILRRVAGEWQRSETGVFDEIWGIAGDSENDLAAVGQNGTILASDDGGATWQQVPSPTDRVLFAVASDGAGRMVAVGGAGVVLLRDGNSWEVTASPTQANLFEVKSVGPRRFMVAGDGGALFEGDGLTWEVIEPIGASENLRAITGSAGSRVVAGWFGAVLDESRDWGTVVNGSRIYAVHAPTDGNAWAVGQGGVAFERVAGSWQPRSMPGSGSFYSLAGPGATDRLAVGDFGTVLHFDGGQWRPLSVPATTALLRSVWYDGSRAMVVGEAGTALVMERGVWRRISAGTNQFLRHVAGKDWQHLFAVGDAGTVLRFNGDGFYPESSPTEANLRGVTTRRNGEIWMVGDGGRIFRREGSLWVQELSPTFNDLRLVHETDGVLYIAGDGGLVWYRDDANESWHQVVTSLPGLWLGAGGSRELFVVGEFGTIGEGSNQGSGAIRDRIVPAIRDDRERSAPR